MANEIELKLLLDGKEVKATLSNVDGLVDEVRKGSKSVGDNISNWGNAVTGFNQGLEVAKKAFNLLSKPLEVAGMFEEAKVQLSVLLGSMDAAEQRIDELSQFSATTPFEFPEIIKASKTLQVFGGDVLAVGDNLRMIGDVSASSGQPIDELALHFGRLYDSIQSGRPAGEALMRLQEIGALTGESRAAIEEAIKTNKDSAETWGIVTNAMSRFDGTMQKQSETLNGMVSNALDQTTLLLAAMGDEIMPIAKDILDVLIPAIGGITDNLDTIIPVLKVVAVSTAAWAVAMYGAEAAAKAKAIATALATNATALFNKILAMNPALAVAAAIITTIAVLREFTDVLDTSVDSMRKNIDAQENEIDSYEQLLRAKKDDIETSKQVAIQNGASREELKKYDTQLQEVIESEKQLAKQRAMLDAQKAAAEYVESIQDQASGFIKDIPLIGGLANDVIKQFDSSEKRLAEQRLSTLTDFSTTAESKILYVNELLKNATGEEKTLLMGVQASLMAVKNVDLKTEIDKQTTSTKKLTQSKKEQAEAEKALKEAQKLEEKKTDIKESFNKKSTIETFKVSVEGESDSAAIQQRIVEEKRNFTELMKSLDNELTESQIDQVKSDLDLSQQKIDILESRNQKILASEEKLSQLKADYILNYNEQLEREKFEAEVRVMTVEEMNNAIIQAEQQKFDLLKQLRDADTQAELDKLTQEIEIANRKEQLLKQESAAIEQNTESQILALARQYDAHKLFLQNFLNMTRQLIKAEIARALTGVLKDALISVPFPFNIALGAAAVGAASALFDELIPEFGTGYVDLNGRLHKDGGETVKVEGGESIINRMGTAKNKQLLKMINDGKQFDVVGNKAINYNGFYGSAPPSSSLNNISQIAVSFDKAINSLDRSINRKLDKVIEASGVKFVMTDFDNTYQDYLKSIGYMKG
jgi:hypothetical protein